MAQPRARALLASLFLPMLACTTVPPADRDADSVPDLQLPFEQYALENGLEVLLHEDHSNPVVAVAVIYHVDSAFS